MKRLRIVNAFLALAATVGLGGQPRTAQEPAPRSVVFSASKLTWKQAMAELQEQTGNAIDDSRSHPVDPMLSLPKEPTRFWPALDAIGRQTGVGFSTYRHDDRVAWIDTPYREAKVSYHGLFRFALKSVRVSHNDETGTHGCSVTMDVAWEPRFHPLYVNLETASVAFAADAKGNKRTETLERQATRSASGSRATELELRMQAPDRSSPSIDLLQGTIGIFGAPRMLDFLFDKLQPIDPKKADPRVSLTQEDVKVSLTQVRTSAARWTIDVLIENPRDAIVSLESYQSWMDNNRIWLKWNDPVTKMSHQLEPTGEAPQYAASGTKLRFEFTPGKKAPLPPSLTGVTLAYRTPNRVVAFRVPFALRDLPLP